MSKEFSELKPKVVLGVAAHPDDLDVTSSGTMAKFIKNGAKVYYLILTDGSKGSDDRSLSCEDLTKIRHKEQTEAAKATGAEPPIFLNFVDGELMVTLELKKQIVKVIRDVKPDVVITMDPVTLYSLERGMINHPDHRAAGQATLDAVFPLARDYKAFPELDQQGIEPHKVRTVLLANFDEHNFTVDISDCIDSKMASLKAHVSQFGDVEMVAAFVKQQAEALGKEAGCQYAEAFKRIDLAY